MQPRIYSAFWLGYCAGLLCLSSAWAGRDEPEKQHPLEELSMGAWLRLSEQERSQVVTGYAGRVPPARFTSTEERRRQSLTQRLSECLAEREQRNKRRQTYAFAS